ncbi:hypothetical protein [Nocardioides marmoriginsengisoli]|uniref:hypothetical protein n=1 Tax=Nocardioides marmoriginsengisoli TaxID=661483 RepID=UPI0011CE4033|nr:hypothetical protein [Nocardioides marmoriginsengisoli]
MKRLLGGRLFWIVLALLVGALVAWEVVGLRSDQAVDDRRDAAVKTATAQVLDLTTLDSETVEGKLAAMAKRTAGDFADQLGGITTTFANLVKQNQITAKGVVDAAGVVSSSDKDAVVIVASSATVTEKGKQPTVRSYRMQITLERQKGEWKVNDMEFVQ